jgi:hypothetical protein
MPTKRVNSKNTKAEILNAYQELEKEYQELQAKKSASPVITPPVVKTTPPKTTVAAAKTEANAAQAPMDEVITTLGQMGEKFNLALSHLSTNMLVEAAALKNVRTTVEAENARLKNLYQLEIEDDSLGILVKKYIDTAEQTQETLKQKRDDADKRWLEKTQAWETEKEETLQGLQEQSNLEKKTQNREETEYRYDLTLKRSLSKEEEAEQKKQQQQALDELEENTKKAWEEREKTLAQREKEFEESKAKVEGFPKELEQAIKKAKDVGIGIARNQAKIKADLAAQEFASEEHVFQLKIGSLEEQVAHQQEQIDKLSKQLENALKQAQELAVKAIEGSSNQSSFDALKEIALEQAKGQPKTK